MAGTQQSAPREPEETPQIESASEQENLKETGRVEAFSDGIFAVAITLLVLNIQVPRNLANGDLDIFLLGQGPVYLAFLTSFATIGVMWVNHHRLFNHIKSSNDTLLALNLMLLLLVVFVPFPTALVAEYLKPGYHLPAVIYSATFVLLALCFNLLWRYASHNNRLLDKKADPQAVQAITEQYKFGPLLYLIAFVLAFLYTPASILWCLLLAIFFALPGNIAARLSLDHMGKRWKR